MKIRGILFDYGGTLDGPASHWLDRFVALYREAGVERSFELVKSAFYRADDDCYADPRVRLLSLTELMRRHVGVQLAALGIDDRDLGERLVRRFVERSEEALRSSRSVLARLAGSYALGVVSNFYGNVDRILRDAGIAPFLRVIVDSTVVGMSKPDPRVFAHALRAIGLPAPETLHVGDSWERDVGAARAAGLRTAWLTDGSRRPAAGESAADLTLRSLEELPVLLAARAPA